MPANVGHLCGAKPSLHIDMAVSLLPQGRRSCQVVPCRLDSLPSRRAGDGLDMAGNLAGTWNYEYGRMLRHFSALWAGLALTSASWHAGSRPRGIHQALGTAWHCSPLFCEVGSCLDKLLLALLVLRNSRRTRCRMRCPQRYHDGQVLAGE